MKNKKIEKNEKYFRPKLESSWTLLRKSWQLYRKHFLDFIEMYLWGALGALPLFAIALMIILINYFFQNAMQESMIAIIIAVIALVLASLWALYYGIRAHIGIWILITHPKLQVRQAFIKSNKYIVNYLVISILSGILLMLLFCALIIPGIIFYGYWAFATMLVIVEGIKSTREALRRSKELVKGYWWPVLGRFILIALIYTILVMIISIPVEYLQDNIAKSYSFVVNVLSTLLTPVLLAYSYHLYKDLAAKK